MRTNYVSKHSRDHAGSEYVMCGADRNRAEFIGNKEIHSLANKHTDSELYILLQISSYEISNYN